MALVVVLLMLMLIAALMAGFATVVMSEQRLQRVDEDRVQSFYGAHAGLEKLTSDLGALFSATYAPTGTQVNALNTQPPSLPGVTFVTTTDGPGYAVAFTPDASGNPAATSRSITSGPFQGFTGLVTSYVVGVTARTGNVGETRLQREVQTVGIPVFQFGVFSESNLSYFAGPDFGFGGRVHTNGHLFLASGATLTLSDKVSAVGEVIRTHLSNGWPTSSGYTGNVRALTAPGAYRTLATTEGSLVNTIGSALNEPAWSNLSVGTYHSYLTNGRTGARQLDLPLVTIGSTPIEMIRRPQAGESTTGTLFQLRYFGLASLRILLSDSAAEITSLPTVTSTAPIALGNVEPAGYTVDANHPPFAVAGSGGNYRVPSGTGLLGGFLKIEKQTSAGTWQDVTLEILNLGIAGANLSRTCIEPNANAVLRLERIADLSSCANGTTTAANYWPKMLFDPREGKLRDDEPTGNTNVYLGGVVHYVELDVNNLRRWFLGQIGTSGSTALNVTGYTVYFSDRRGNKNASGQETGEYGAEDVVNPASATGAVNGALDTGEDINGNGALDTYGQTPRGLAVTWTAPLDSAARPWTAVTPAVAQSNPPRFFRRALKLVNGSGTSIIAPGLTVVTENPLYVQGDYNASANFAGSHAAAAVLADAVTLLSNNWSDRRSFVSPYDPGQRSGIETWYRMAVIAGKGLSFPHPTAGNPYQDFGTDGGVHNFLRLLEAWAGTVHYRGSLASFYYNRQAVGTYKCCTNVYSPSTRDYQFDTDFLTPALLPPQTPMFRDVNTLGFLPVTTAPR
ncbi:MAG: hypothetical protein NTY02_08990 [Acidobacteria bacterium]|nr:hypothetical protein [Acidobacteriota bacterium]